jgi:hypothetical protein
MTCPSHDPAAAEAQYGKSWPIDHAAKQKKWRRVGDPREMAKHRVTLGN